MGSVRAKALFAVGLFTSCASIAQAQTTGLEDLVGARGGQAEGELQRRGYGFVRVEKSDDRSYTYWWSDERRQCVTIATMDGRYASIQPTLPPDCRKPGNLRPNPNYAQRPAMRPGPGYPVDPGYGRPGCRRGRSRPERRARRR